ncbi:methylated-DNA--[protein]-cysteine S-methyltransferase [Labilibaculum sp. A4]|uniref:Methylated-DNA--protein-cysteine methyltransferase n=1 Tax=Labilibaculum euxinus TaxID=2686357 RepID=A0A425YAV6_9BACT|nr:methylated-DNA--[protein]-cysteine S-methyltransferase [Labilibaculum euxinus]MDQ1771173.1 methylated-DNA--[protein]-cysteine S-methyltransferase [Labilibaculum euxinus]MUP39966.1 methylated-DNA--[protein]-cysteine S-methyltransferase [Labilibaculum euxinus]MVB09171.1 methylated-DNA--[protein]-cysteine S-methyltransferase [Labilibaculum euxinus]MWN76820.1 methylated-DNA--[protein]-cysteine S-methyltransferase [Labilibaculum euxinus]
MIYYDILPSPVGNLLLVADDSGLKQIQFDEGNQSNGIKPNWIKDSNKLKTVADQLISYFANERTTFDVKLSPDGTAFQKQIWNQLLKIPYGKTCSYLDIALAINKPSACRAIGMANSKNPIPIIIPCHRVIGKNGKLTGYAGGLSNKAKLLEIENIDLTPSKDQYLLF